MYYIGDYFEETWLGDDVKILVGEEQGAPTITSTNGTWKCTKPV